ncbi:MAG TPA: hypothetical protein VLC46_04505 [Thermoanaerobaculia bacterium]|jgi:hypothetical protein|nr:hypothetical protein [Thermoanaerobaculia bacterium]
MHYQVKIGPLAGFVPHAVAPDQVFAMCVGGFFTTDDGAQFYSKLEAIQGLVLGPYLETGAPVSTIDRFVVVISGETADVYINAFDFELKAVSRRNAIAGEKMYRKDIGGIGAVRLPGIQIPQTAAVIFYFSIGWRRGLYFNLMPLQGEPLGDIERVLGEQYDKLWFSDLYAIPNDSWPTIFETGWFPFTKLIGGTFENMPDFLQRDILSAWEEGVFKQFDEARLRQLIDGWRDIPAFKEHIPFAETAAARYGAGDYVSAISNLWPRIEGALRHLYLGSEQKPGQKKLLANVREIMDKKAAAPNSYLPGLFEQYLLQFYFRDFSLKDDRVELGRHALAHGVTKAAEYDQRRTLQGFLILDQIACYAKLGWSSGSEPPLQSDAPAATPGEALALP